MTWSAETSAGFEQDKIAALVVPYTRGFCLDLGCGARKCWPHMVGIDQRKGGDENLVCDIAKLSMFADGVADGVFSSHALEDFEDTRAVLAEWWRVVKVGGYLSLYLPHADLYPNVGQEGANPAHKQDFRNDDILNHLAAIADACGQGFDLLENQVRDGTNEYSMFIVAQKRGDAEVVQRLWQRNPDGKKRCLVARFGAIGDMIQASTVLPGLRAQGYHITLCTTPAGEQVVRHNPYIDEFLLQDKDQVPNPALNAYFEALKERYDRIVNLSEAVEGSLLLIAGRASHWLELPARRAIVGKVNYLERHHEMAQVPMDRFDARFYATEEEMAWAREWRAEMEGPVICWVMGGTSNHKIYPFIDVVVAWLLQKTNAHIVMAGGPNEEMIQAGVLGCLIKDGHEVAVVERVKPMVNQWSVREALSFAQVADVVVGPETGILNAVGLTDVAKVVMLSHSSPENLTKHWRQTVVLTPEGCHCAPCHALHYTWDHCHRVEETAAALCASSISPERLYEAVVFALSHGCPRLAAD